MTIKQNKDKFEEVDDNTLISMKWYPPLDWINYKESEFFTDKISPQKRYFVMLYHAVLFLGLNEIGPVNINEMQFCVIALVTCALLESLLFSEMAEIVTNYSQDRSIIQNQMDQSFDVMCAINLSRQNKRDINDFFNSNLHKKIAQDEFNQLMLMISPSCQ